MTEAKGSCLPCKGTETRDWISWINLQPPGPFDFHVHGEVYVPNPGVEPILSPKTPPGINPRILDLDLFLIQKPGIWPQMLVWKAAEYHKFLHNNRFDWVNIYCDGDLIATIEVEEFY